MPWEAVYIEYGWDLLPGPCLPYVTQGEVGQKQAGLAEFEEKMVSR